MKGKDQIVFGIHAVLEAIDAGKELEKVLIKANQGTSDIFSDLRKKLIDDKIPFQHVPMEKLNSITRKNHQGVIAYISEISYGEIEFILPQVFEKGKTPLLLVLDQVSDVRNFGAISRSAECAGVHGLVIPESGSARIHEDAVKTSAGALLNIPVCRTNTLPDAVNYIKNSGVRIIGAVESADKSFFDADLKDPVAIIMGSEEKGISTSLLALCDEAVSIPVHGKISSLNVSVAASLLVYEVVRQRG